VGPQYITRHYDKVLCQSHYVKREWQQFLGSVARPPRFQMLQDYLRLRFFSGDWQDDSQTDRVLGRVVWSPARDGGVTVPVLDHLQKLVPWASFVALKGIPQDDVWRHMQAAQVYLDLGNFPGKDRMPREAGWLGCTVLLANRGAATDYDDFPFPTARLEPSWSPNTLAQIVAAFLVDPDGTPHVAQNHMGWMNSIRCEERLFQAQTVAAFEEYRSPMSVEV
jgi:hypothetical protein